MTGIAARRGGFFTLSTDLVHVYTAAPWGTGCTVFIVSPEEQHASEPG